MPSGPDSCLIRLRRAELECARPYFEHAARVLEIGGGSGYQASILKSWGCQVTSIDITRAANECSYHPVCIYDGVRIPAGRDQFDIVFSSNVLEHVERLPELLRDTDRVLKPMGLAIHILPTSSWRLWTSLTHYPHLVKVLLGLPFAKDRTNDAGPAHTALKKYGFSDFVRRVIFAPPHGIHSSAIGELYYFRKSHWSRLFKENGFDSIQTTFTGVYYSGNVLIPTLSIKTRKRLSTLAGSSTCMFILKH